MEKLENLYDCADKYLLKDKQDWSGFARGFSEIFDAKMALHRPKAVQENNVRLDFVELDEIISTTNPETMKEFLEKGMIKLEPMFKEVGNPFEPFRRTDILSDKEYLEFEISQQFLLPNNVFYLMIVHAILADNSFLVLYIWRGKENEDFSEIEKQRLALFMRYLARLVRVGTYETNDDVNNEIIKFGKKYHLTETETEILADLLEGKSLRYIADSSDRSYGTVRWHVQNILQKCQVKSKKNLLNEFYALIKR